MKLFKRMLMGCFLFVYSVQVLALDFCTEKGVFERIFEGDFASVEDYFYGEEEKFSQVSQVLHLMPEEEKQAWMDFLEWTETHADSCLREKAVENEGDLREFEKVLEDMPFQSLESLFWVLATAKNKERKSIFENKYIFWPIITALGVTAAVLAIRLATLIIEDTLRYAARRMEARQIRRGVIKLKPPSPGGGIILSVALSVAPEGDILIEQMKGKSLFDICSEEWAASSIGCQQYLEKELL